MSLLARIAETEGCAVIDCQRHRTRDSLFCAEHLADMWGNRLRREPSGKFTVRRRFTARELTFA